MTTRAVPADEAESAGVVSCAECGQPATLTKFGERVWGWANRLLQKRGQPRLDAAEVAICGERCRRVRLERMYAADLAADEYERTRRAAVAAEKATQRTRGPGSRL